MSLQQKILENLKPGITVALVSIPLSIAISIASGAGPVPGIITGFWATIIAGFLGGSNYNIIGPAGALTSVLFGATLVLTGVATPWVLPLLAVLTGLIILFVYAIRGERFIRYIPSSVVHGFAAGVAIVIAVSQLRDAFGLAKIYKPTGHFAHDLELLFSNMHATNGYTFAVFITMFIFLILWKRYIKKIPGVIPATLIGIGIGFFLKDTSFIEHIPRIVDRYGALSLTLVQVPAMSDVFSVLSFATLSKILPVALLIAVIAILETLITARMADQMTSTRFNVRKETKGLGFANIVSGVMGGLPATGVFIRTGLNVKSGATHKTAQIIAGTVTGLGALLLLPLMQYIPMAIIAALLCMTAIGLIDTAHFKHFWRHSRADFWIGIVVVFLVLLFDPGVAVAVGVLIALFILLERTTDGSSEVFFNHKGMLIHHSTSKHLSLPTEAFDTVVYTLSGFVSYVDAELHVDRLEKIAAEKNTKHIILRMRNLDYCDDEAITTFEHVIKNIQKKGISVYLASVSNEALKTHMQSYEVFKDMFVKDRVYDKASHAVTALAK